MPSLKDLRRRIRTVKNTQLITRAMRSVAASKMRRTHERRDKARPYVERLQQLVANLVNSVGSEGQPLLDNREVNKRLMVVFSSDRGLCGAFNNTIARYALDRANEIGNATFYVVGKRAASVIRRQGLSILKSHEEFSGNVDVPKVLEISGELRDLFLSRDYDAVELVYNRAINAMNYRPYHELLLPLKQDELAPSGDDKSAAASIDYIFEPDPQTLLQQLLPKFLETKLLFTFVDAFAAEHQARMMAMSAANTNCRELIDSLTLEMNKARQTSITTEILEIVSGANALAG